MLYYHNHYLRVICIRISSVCVSWAYPLPVLMVQYLVVFGIDCQIPPKSSRFASVVLRTYDFVGITLRKTNACFAVACFSFELVIYNNLQQPPAIGAFNSLWRLRFIICFVISQTNPCLQQPLFLLPAFRLLFLLRC